MPIMVLVPGVRHEEIDETGRVEVVEQERNISIAVSVRVDY